MKNKSVVAMMLAFTMCFTTVCPAFAAENAPVETEDVNESESEGNAVSEESVPDEDAAASEQAQEDAVLPKETVTEDPDAEGTNEEATDESTDEAGNPAEEGDAAEDDSSEEGTDAGQAQESQKTEETTAQPEFAGTITAVVEGESVIPENGGDESAEYLFEKYVNNAFGLSGSSARREARKITGTRLKGNDYKVYMAIAGELPAVAAGGRSSTEFELTPEVFGLDKLEWTAGELGVDSILETDETGATVFSQDAYNAALAKVDFEVGNVSDALLADFPYEMYWYEKTRGVKTTRLQIYGSYNYEKEEYVIGFSNNQSVQFSVAEEFAAGEYTVDTEIGQAVQSAVGNANAIVEQYSGSSDEDKLHGYKEEICDLVSYNDDAAQGHFDYNYGNPWQMIWVFDGDDTTNVVCEGYSKAFKYLCDKSDFDGNVSCILVSGTMDGGEGAGNHMWNIVKMGNGLNYLVDVTNCDNGTIGYPDQLFLARTEELFINEGLEVGYSFQLNSGNIVYQYDNDTLNYYDQKELSLAEFHVHSLSGTEAVSATCTEAGNIAYWTCGECGMIFSDAEGTEEITIEDTVIPAAGHTLIHVDPTPATDESAGNIEYYRCEACGKLFEDENCVNEITEEDIIIPAYPVITEQPEDVTAKYGARVHFHVAARSEGGSLSYKWEYSKNDGVTWRVWSGKTQADVEARASTANDGMLYRCVVSNETGNVVSNAARLTLMSAPVITTQPEDVYGRLGQEVAFTVAATGFGNEALSYRWEYSKNNGETWSKWSGKKGATASVVVGTGNNGVLYRCIVSDSNGSTTSDSARLTRYEGPIITRQPSNAYGVVGGTAVFSIEAMTLEGESLNYQWQFSTNNGETWRKWSGKTEETASAKVGSANIGCLYRCIVSDGVVSVTSGTAELGLIQEPMITKQPENVSVRAKERAVFCVEASESSGEVIYKWQFSGDNGETWRTWTGKTEASASATAGNANNGFLYRCKISNKLGSVYSEAARLTLLK